ncbi:MAG TPA: hypothetical protein VJS44_07185 [Pyrinomonadaceae bacterium]|nr:hypothetical protein [Pyrinomonadaceae bacterium]
MMTDARLYLAPGKSYNRTRQMELSLEAFQKSARLKPDLAEAYFGMGHANAIMANRRGRGQ